MKILALDAATEACSVALLNNDEVVSHFEICPQQHSQKLLPFVDKVLVDAGLSLNQLDGLAFGQGPGSFTGVRIGVAITQGLAFAADLPVVGVSNLAMMAQEAIERHQANVIVPAIDARMSEVYFGIYENVDGLARSLQTEVAIKPEEIDLPETIITGSAVSAGTGWQTYGDILNEKMSVKETTIHLPNAKYMLPLASAEFIAGNSLSAEQAQPNYVRDEVTWKKLPGR